MTTTEQAINALMEALKRHRTERSKDSWQEVLKRAGEVK